VTDPPRGATGPVRSGPVRRSLSALVDVLLALALAFLLGPTVGQFLAERSFVMLHVGSPDTVWRGPVALWVALFGRLVWGFPFAWSVLAVAEPLGGASAGKVLAAARVTTVRGRPAPAKRLLRRFVWRIVPAVVLLLALLAGWWPLAVLAAAATAAAAAGWLPVLAGRRALHDRLAATDVFRT
jgi:hypothetical protein